MAHPRQAQQLAVGAGDEVVQGAAGGVRRGDALAEVPAGPGEPGAAVEADAGPEVTGHAEDAAPVVGDADVAQVGEPAHEEAAQPLGDVRLGSPLLVLPLVIRRTPTAAEVARLVDLVLAATA